MVNKLLINFSRLRNDSILCFPEETIACAPCNFCYPVRPQISSFFVDNAKVRKIQGTSKFIRQKSTQKSTLTEIIDNSATVATVATVLF